MLAESFASRDWSRFLPGLRRGVGLKEAPAGSEEGASSVPTSSVLLIEDDPAIADMYRFQLEADGYRVKVAHNGYAGWDLIKASRPDLVLLDLRLPGLDGFQVLAKVRKDQQLHELPVVVLTNYGDPHMVKRALELGVSDYLVKSRVTPQEISRGIPAWIKGPGDIPPN